MDFVESVFADRNEQRREMKLHGIYTAKVTGRMGDSFELSYLGMGGNAPSAPARVMTPGAGRQRGAYFMPEVGDEVVVAFEGGDSNMPIILGGVWNSESPVPDQAKPSAENDVRTIVSRSGHELTFDDGPAQEKVSIKSKGGHEVILDDTPPGKITIKSKLGSEVVLDDTTGSVRVTSPLSIMLQSAAITVAGSLAVGPPVPAPGAPPPVPTPMTLQSPLQIVLQAPLLTLQAAAIQINTTGTQLTSLVTIDGRPWATVL